MKKITLALDISTSCTGWAYYIYDDNKIVTGAIKPRKSLGWRERVEQMQLDLQALTAGYEIVNLVVEQVLYKKPGNIDSTIKLAKANGILTTTLKHENLMEFLPSEWRAMLGMRQGRGVIRDDLKAQAIALARADGLKLRKTEDDEAEAYLILKAVRMKGL